MSEKHDETCYAIWRMLEKGSFELVEFIQEQALGEEPGLLKQAQPGKRMAEALEKLARIHALSTITEPKRWEREIRQDRHLPERA